MSIRLRLTLLYTAILALTLVVFSVALYFTLAQVTLNELKFALKNERERLTVNEFFLVTETKYRVQTYAQLLEFDGDVIQKTGNLGDETLPLSREGLQTVQNGGYVFDIVNTSGGRLLVYTDRAKRPLMLVQIARSLEDYDQSLNALRRILIAGSTIATIVAFGIGWALSGAALRPIDRITQTAHAIGAERDFGRRVPHVGPQDEIGRLATTINGMLVALQGAYRQEAQALQAQRRFVADASHELRTPLTTIRGNIALLQRVPPISEPDRVAVLDDMSDESERMSRLVNDLLVLARADAGRPLRTDSVPVKPLIDDVCRKARALSPNHVVACDNVQDVVVAGDADALKQVLLILLDNALKFTPLQGSIMIATTTVDQRVAIRVQDTGVGIASSALPHIFERFYRGDSSRTGGGAGLGLAIAKALVDGQHGSLSVTSELGVGTTFTLELPQVVVPRVTPREQEAVVSGNIV
jgi:signal transduction histidine kinase